MLELDLSSFRERDARPTASDAATSSAMPEVLTVCTGNICRSPLAEQLLRRTLPGVLVRSAGTHARPDDRMPEDASELARRLGVAADEAAAHRARRLTESVLTTPALVLTMTRAHRGAVVDLAPTLLRRTFTVREFARLADTLSDDALSAAGAGPTPAARFAGVVTAVAAQRGAVLPPMRPDDDDVVDPYLREWEVYERSAAELVPAIRATTRALRHFV